MQIFIEVLPVLLKLFVGAIALFLILFGIHWIAILAGLVFGAIYYRVPVQGKHTYYCKRTSRR